MHPILTITLNPSLDISTTVPALQPEKKLRCDAPVTEPGGGGINVARVLHRFGEQVMAVYLAGGSTGSRLTGLLETAGIPGAPVEIAAETRENIHITDAASGRQYRFVMPGPVINHAENLSALNKMADLMAGTEYAIISGSLPEGTSPELMQKLSAMADVHNTALIADLSGEGLRQAVLAGVYLIKPNLGELAALAEKESLTEQTAVEAAQTIITAGGAKVIVISMGAAGAILVTHDLVEKIQAPVVKTLSTVGAGDSMVAGIVYGLRNGFGLANAVRYGIACGTAATLASGTGLCQKTDADRLFWQISLPVEQEK